MFRIGEFSKIAQVPGSLLRYYDEIGLLKPAHIDEWTGYRYYSATQLPRLHRILALKGLGLTLNQITQLLDEDISAEEIRGMFVLKKAQTEQALQEEIIRLRHIEARLQQIDDTAQPAFDIVLKQVPAQHFLSLRQVLPGPEAAFAIMQELIYTLPDQVSQEQLGYFATVVHSETLESDRLDIELGVIINEKSPGPITLPGERLLTLRTLPAVATMTAVTRIGGFENSCGSYGAIGVWVEENGYRIAGPGREILIQPPYREAVDEMVTEIQFPVEPLHPTFT